MEKKTPYFNREATDILKGIALIFMFGHHFWTFPTWWTGSGIPAFGDWILYLRNPLKICVPVFCFITGYTYFFNKNKNYRYSLKKITHFLISYWTVMVFLVILAYIFSDYRYTPPVFLKELLGFQRPTMIFCWYVSFYCAFMLFLPVLSKVFGRLCLVDIVLGFFVFPGIFVVLEQTIPMAEFSELFGNLQIWFPCVCAGYFAAFYNWFEKIDKVFAYIKEKKLKIVLNICLFLVLPFFRNVYLFFYMYILGTDGERRRIAMQICADAVIVFFFTYAVLYLFREIKFPAQLRRILIQIGKKSMLMWFVSCVFFNTSKNVTQKLLYCTGNPFVILILGTVICYIASVLLNLLISRIFRVIQYIFSKQGSGV